MLRSLLVLALLLGACTAIPITIPARPSPDGVGTTTVNDGGLPDGPLDAADASAGGTDGDVIPGDDGAGETDLTDAAGESGTTDGKTPGDGALPAEGGLDGQVIDAGG